jgi:hypothetical protein
MAQLKDQQTGADGDNFTVGGGFTCTGAAVFSSTVAVTGNASFSNNVSANGNVTLGNNNTDAHVLNGTLTAATAGKIRLDDSVTTASAPVLSFDGDTDTGIYRPAANIMGLVTGGTERVRIANAGLTINNAFTCTGAAVLSSTLDVTGAAVFSGTVDISGNATATTQAITNDSTRLATTAFVRDIVPTGVIVMWSGTIAAIPTGWLLCNGSDGTPDLRNRFVIGANADDSGVAKTNVTGSATQTGGSKDAIVVSHTHNLEGSTNEAGEHRHATNISRDTTGGSLRSFGQEQTDNSAMIFTDFQGIHSHTLSGTVSTTGSSGTNANLPPYYALAYIMKT